MVLTLTCKGKQELVSLPATQNRWTLSYPRRWGTEIIAQRGLGSPRTPAPGAGRLIGSSSLNSPGAGVSPGDTLHITDEHTEVQGGKDLPKVAELERS